MNDLLARMRKDDVAFGIGVTMLRGQAPALLAKAAGYDWLFIDMEHGIFSLRDASEMCLAALSCGVTPIIRVRINALDEAARILDNGAQGIVIPHVDTAEDARQVVSALRYPPRGDRAWGGSAAAFGYRAPNAMLAREQADSRTLLIVTIESKAGVDNSDAIAGIEGVDVLLFGATDLSLDLGIPGQVESDEIYTALKTTAAACRKHNKILGFGGGSPAVAKRFFSQGPRFVLAGMDHALLLGAFDQRMADFEDALSAADGSATARRSSKP